MAEHCDGSDGWGEAREECPGSWLGHVGRWWVVSFTYTGPPRSLRLGKMWHLIFVYVEPAVSMGHQMAIPGVEPRARVWSLEPVTKAWWPKEPRE